MTRLFFVIQLVLISTCAFTQTIIPSGDVSGTWSLAASPYFVVGDILIPEDSTWIIEPGVVIELEHDVRVTVEGNILAIGTETDSIVFQAEEPDFHQAFEGFEFNQTSLNQDSSIFEFCRISWTYKYSGGGFSFDSFSKCRISNCKIEYCYSTGSGGAIRCYESDIALRNNLFKDNVSLDGSGGAVSISFSNLSLTGNTYLSNSAEYGADLYVGASTVTTVNETFWNGGPQAIFAVGSTVSIENDTIYSYTSSGIYASESVISILNSVILENGHISGSDGGGGVFCINSRLTLIGSVIENNETNGLGGGIYAKYCESIIENNSIIGNSAGSFGGGVYIDSSFVLSNNLISGNTADQDNGGGIFVDTSSVISIISYNTISNNSATNGGGIAFRFSSPTVVGDTLRNNVATSFGSGIYTKGTHSLISNNTLQGCGIATWFSSDSIINNLIDSAQPGINLRKSSPLIEGNIISNNSRGIESYYDSNPIINNNVLTGNYSGGGIWAEDSITITNNIISGNSAEEGAGIYCYSYSGLVIRPLISGNVISYNTNTQGVGGIGIDCFQLSPYIYI